MFWTENRYRSQPRVCFQLLEGKNPMVTTCLVASMKLSCSFAHVFSAVKATESRRVLLITKPHIRTSLVDVLYFQHVHWVFRSLFPIMQNSLAFPRLRQELRLSFCMWDNECCYDGVVSPGKSGRRCVHNLATEDICFRHSNVQDRLNTPVPWPPFSTIDKKRFFTNE